MTLIRPQTSADPGDFCTRQIKTKQLSLVHTKTLKMTDDVLAVKYSPDNKLLAVSLLDSTVKVFFQDSLKFFLSLYGHKVRGTR
jgi:U3 small nucleolar RNA-associated protein 12